MTRRACCVLNRFLSARGVLLAAALLFAVTPGLVGCGGSSGGGSSAATASDVAPPLFRGVQSVGTAGGPFVRLGWAPAVDDGGTALTYRIYVAATSGGQNFAAPVTTTQATSIILSNTFTPLIGVGQEVFFVVRAIDAAGNEDENIVELGVTPVAPTAVAFVSDTAGGAGTLGDATDPFPTIQAGVTAIEGNGGGVVLVDAAAGGTTYNEEVNVTAAVTGIGLFGGFDRFSTLPANPTGAQILDIRDVDGHETRLSGAGLLPMVDGDLVRVANMGSPTWFDGFTLRDTDALTPLTGTLRFSQGSAIVNGVGTNFTAELFGGEAIQLDADSLPLIVNEVLSDTTLRLANAYPLDTANGPGSAVVNAPEAMFRAINAVLQYSCCRMYGSGFFDADTVAQTDDSQLRIVGNQAHGVSDETFQLGGGMSHLRFQGNETWLRGQTVTHDASATSNVHVPAGGLQVYITNNHLSNNRDTLSADHVVNLAFAPAVDANGGALMVMVEQNEIRNHNSDGVNLEGLLLVGDNGSSSYVARHNLFVGSSTDALQCDGTNGNDPFVAVNGTFEFYENEFFNNDSSAIECNLGISANQSTVVMVRDNFYATGESEQVDIEDESGPTPDLSDGGRYEVTMRRNLNLGGGEDFHFDIGAPHGGTAVLTAIENTILLSGDPCIEVEVNEPVGTTTVVRPYPVNVVCVNVFNNDLHGSDDECVEFDPGNSQGLNNLTAVIGYIGFNLARNGSDGSDGAITVDQFTDGLGCLIERNFTGIGGQDSSEAGIELAGGEDNLGNEIHVRNNVAAMASSGGFDMDSRGGMGQFVNNTAGYTGAQSGESGFDSGTSFDQRGDGQDFILNCLSAFSGGPDMDRVGGLRASYTLVRDEPNPVDLGNVGGDPFFLTDLDNLTAFPQIPADQLDTLFLLQSTSPAINAGHPHPRYNDTDGSRNDMGAYGGPGGGGPMGQVAPGTPIPFVFIASFPSVHLYSGNRLPQDTDPIHLGFNQAVDPATLDAGITVLNDGVVVPGTLSLVPDSKGLLVRFTPAGSLTPGATAIVEVQIDRDLRDTNGQALRFPWSFRFATDPGLTQLESEPNDDGIAGRSPADLAAAQSIASLAASGVGQLSGSVATSDEVDVYSFTATPGQRLQATLLDARIGGGNNGALHFDLFDANFNRITTGVRNNYNDGFAAANGDPYVNHVFRDAGTYFLIVTSPDNPGAAQNYILQAVLD